MSTKMTDPAVAAVTKAAIHGALGMLAGLCATYNVSAWITRREQHLAWNSAIYAGLVAFEIIQVAHHARNCGTAIRCT